MFRAARSQLRKRNELCQFGIDIEFCFGRSDVNNVVLRRRREKREKTKIKEETEQEGKNTGEI